MQTGEGKTNTGKAVFGRILRHLDPRLCGIGALGLYLLMRFNCTKEYELFDLKNNKSWFNVKLLRGLTRQHDNKGM